MNIYIPTFGRHDHQPVYHQLVAAGLRPVLVVDKRDPYHYNNFEHLRWRFESLHDKEHWIAMRQYTVGPYIQLDDDLTICTARAGQRIEVATGAEIRAMLIDVQMYFGKRPQLAQIGVHQRAFVNYADKPYTYNKGMFPFRVRAYNPLVWKRPLAPYPIVVDGHNDVWTWFDLVRQGLDYATITDCCHKDNLYKPKPTHFEPVFADKVKGFRRLLDEMDAWNFTVEGKHGPRLQFAKLAAHYRDSESKGRGL